jgi:hypothetical protein
MAGQDHQRGKMDISGQKDTWNGFLTGSTWGSLIILLLVGYSVLSLAIGLHWAVSLGLMALVGIIAGLALNLGARWMATVVVMVVLALIVQAIITLFGVFL